MAVCKLCMKTFKQLTVTHVVKKHGLKGLDDYYEQTKDIEVPAEVLEENEKIESEYSAHRAQKAVEHHKRRQDKKAEKEKKKKAIAAGNEEAIKTDLAALLQFNFIKDK